MHRFFFKTKLLSADCINRASCNASAAICTSILIDNIFCIAFGNATYGTFSSARTALDALVTNYMCHWKNTSKYLMYIL